MFQKANGILLNTYHNFLSINILFKFQRAMIGVSNSIFNPQVQFFGSLNTVIHSLFAIFVTFILKERTLFRYNITSFNEMA